MDTTTIFHSDQTYDREYGVWTPPAEEWMIYHNGDYSGEVIIVSPEEHRKSEGYRIPYGVLEKLVLGKLAQDRMREIEDLDYDDMYEAWKKGII